MRKSRGIRLLVLSAMWLTMSIGTSCSPELNTHETTIPAKVEQESASASGTQSSFKLKKLIHLIKIPLGDQEVVLKW